MIELSGLGKTYHTKAGLVEAIKNIDLKIEKGDIYGIIGLSGAGKSTLVRCINFLETPTAGKVFFDGKDLSALSSKELLATRRQMSMIFQGFNLLSQRNVLKNVRYPLEIAKMPKSAADKKARELLKIVGLSDREKAYPSQLSGGQKQRVAIARALATDPKVLLCDEATSALDPNTTDAILDLLKEINKTLGVTIIIITHEMKVIKQICNKVAVIDNSVIVEKGNVSDIFINPQSKIAKELILTRTEIAPELKGERRFRVVFDGNSATAPIISNITVECATPVNIFSADIKNINGKSFGEMLIGLPDRDEIVSRVNAYLSRKNIYFKEDTKNV